MTEHLELAARCEAATGPDWQLATEIWKVVDPDAYEGAKKRAYYSGNRQCVPVPAYTASLDAAMTLVPWDHLDASGFFYCLDRDYQTGLWTARFDQAGDECGHGETYMAVGKSAALALCAAALRARASQGQSATQGEE